MALKGGTEGRGQSGKFQKEGAGDPRKVSRGNGNNATAR